MLTPALIAQELVRIARRLPGESEAASADGQPDLSAVVQILHQGSGVDFRNYKFNTFHRRVARRMQMAKVADLNAYVDLLLKTPAEVEALYQDVLINVTGFFRNPDAFALLKSKVFARLLKDRARTEPLRVWALGCSTGQEAYSLAMLYVEVAEELGSKAPLQLFATDLNAACVDSARAGVYARDQVQEISPERLGRFFVQIDGHYRIVKSLRDACVFSRHNVLTDPPFSRMDLISCRNLLIYMEPVLQRQVLPTLHYALKPEGTLFLGSSESVGSLRALFEPEDARRKIYRKKGGSTAQAQSFAPHAASAPRAAFTPIVARAADGATELGKDADRFLLARYAPPGVLVTGEMEIVQFRGDTSAFLAPAPGKASLNLLKMLREGLLVSVRAAIQRATRDGVSVREENLRVSAPGGVHDCALEVHPIPKRASQQGGFLILFHPAGGAPEARPAPVLAPASALADDADTARLARELGATRDYLQSVVEEHEAANEELQSANEEIQSANEELQSTNEELETSKEEIQSSNEELATVNDELNNRNLELNRINNDLVNLLDGVQMPIVMLGRDLRVRRFTPAAEKLLHLIPADAGRPLSDIRLNLIGVDDLPALLAEVLDQMVVREREVRGADERWYSLRLRPYKTLDNRIDGVLMLLVDVDVLKRAHEYMQSIIATVREPLLVLDHRLRVRSASRAFCEDFQVSVSDTEGQRLAELGNGQWNIPALLSLLGEALRHDRGVQDYEVEHEFPHLGRRIMRINAARVLSLSQATPSLLVAIEDITKSSDDTRALSRHAEDMAEADHRKDEFLALLAHELRNPLAPIRNALQVIQRSGGDAAQLASSTAMMQRQVDQMVRLVDDLLDASRITHGKIELRRERSDLLEVVRQAVEGSRPMCEAQQHTLSVVLPEQPIVLDADPARLVQVIGNLLNNAAKFTPAGGHIAVTLERQDAQAVVRVRDNGIGLDAAQHLRIFEMFVQADTSLKRASGGLGIGLALVRTLVGLHGGTVELFSAGAGQGCEFTVRLPIVALAPQAAVAARASLNGDAQVSAPRRILVVDDNRDSAESLSILLQMGGHETRMAHDGVEAVEAAEAFRPDVIVLDLGLPRLDGYQAAREIRKTAWGQGVRLVALSGWGQSEARQKTREAGFDEHLVKPLDRAGLARLLGDDQAG